MFLFFANHYIIAYFGSERNYFSSSAIPMNRFRHWALIALNFVVYAIVATMLLSRLMGYTLDISFHDIHISKTGGVFLSIQPAEVTVSVDNEEKSIEKSPAIFTNVRTGLVRVDISAEEYMPVQFFLSVDPTLMTQVHDIVLIPKKWTQFFVMRNYEKTWFHPQKQLFAYIDEANTLKISEITEGGVVEKITQNAVDSISGAWSQEDAIFLLLKDSADTVSMTIYSVDNSISENILLPVLPRLYHYNANSHELFLVDKDGFIYKYGTDLPEPTWEKSKTAYDSLIFNEEGIFYIEDNKVLFKEWEGKVAKVLGSLIDQTTGWGQHEDYYFIHTDIGDMLVLPRRHFELNTIAGYKDVVATDDTVFVVKEASFVVLKKNKIAFHAGFEAPIKQFFRLNEEYVMVQTTEKTEVCRLEPYYCSEAPGIVGEIGYVHENTFYEIDEKVGRLMLYEF